MKKWGRRIDPAPAISILPLLFVAFRIQPQLQLLRIFYISGKLVEFLFLRSKSEYEDPFVHIQVTPMTSLCFVRD